MEEFLMKKYKKMRERLKELDREISALGKKKETLQVKRIN